MNIKTENELEAFYQKYEDLGLRYQPGTTLAGKLFNMYRFKDMLPEEIKDMTLKQQLQAVYLTESDIEDEYSISNIQCSASVDEQIERELAMENEIAEMILSPNPEINDLVDESFLDPSKDNIDKARATLLARYILERVLEEFRPDLF